MVLSQATTYAFLMNATMNHQAIIRNTRQSSSMSVLPIWDNLPW
jgi:hypothetical protein